MRLSIEDAAYLDTLAATLGLDRASTLRMIVREACLTRSITPRRRKTLPPGGTRG